MASPSIDKLVESFESTNIPPIDGEPTYATFHEMHELLNSKAASVSTNLVCGTLGHLCLNLPPTVYAALLATKVVPPLNPGTTPIIPSGATGPKAASIRYAHNAATLAFNTFSNANHALRQQFLGAVKDTFLRVKHKPHHRYSGSSTLDLLTHLYKMYAIFSNSDWLAKDKSFREPYLPTFLIKVAWRQIYDAIAYADAGPTPYSSKQVTDNVYQLVLTWASSRGIVEN